MYGALSTTPSVHRLCAPYDVGTYKVLTKPDLAVLEKRHALRPGVSREMVVVSGHVPESDLAAMKVDSAPSEAGFTGQRR